MKTYLLVKTVVGFIFYPFIIKLKRNVFLQGKLIVKSIPYIHLKNNSMLYIGNNVMLNSSNYKYHLNMFSGIKILADGENSEIHIGDNTRIHGSCIHAKSKIYIGKNCLIAANCQIIDSNGHETLMERPQDRIFSMDKPREIIIEDNVWIGANCIILKGVKIGSGSIIAAGSVVVNDIPCNAISRGNPAVVIRELKK